MISWAQDPNYLAWAEGQLKVKFDPRAAVWLTSLDQSGRILGVVIFSRFTVGNCEVTVAAASSHWLSRKFMLAVAYYAFVQCEHQRVTAIIAVGNEKSLSLAQQLGFQVEGKLRSWFQPGNQDAFILGLLRDDCKQLKDLNGLPIGTAST